MKSRKPSPKVKSPNIDLISQVPTMNDCDLLDISLSDLPWGKRLRRTVLNEFIKRADRQGYDRGVAVSTTEGDGMS